MRDYVIETERLIQRPLTVEDCDAVFEWAGDADVARSMVYTVYTSRDKLKEWLRSLREGGTEISFGFERKTDRKLIGSGGIGPDARKNGFWGFGYNLRKDCWGEGYATEAAKAMIRFANERFGAKSFCSSHAEPNKSSGRVMEKCGLHFVAYGEFSKLDGSCRMRSMEYEGELFP